jgi:hypothetical protein
MKLEILLLSLIIGLPILFIMINRTKNFKSKINSIKNGMSYSEVESILGEANSKTLTDNLIICNWTLHGAPRIGFDKYYSITVTVVFQNDKVVSSVINNG